MPKKEGRFRKFLSSRFSLRLHMSLILAATVFAGLFTTKLLLVLHVGSMLVRYPVAVLFSYAAFFLFVKMWLICITSSDAGSRLVNSVADGGGDILDFPGGSFSGSSPLPSFSGGGSGTFGGGGTSGSFEAGISGVSDLSTGSGSAGGVADTAGDAVSGVFDGDDAWVVIILGILLALVCGVGVYLIYQAPMILSEAAFQGVLATSLIRHMKKMGDPDWMGSVLRTTIFPFLFVFIIAVAAAAVGHHAAPTATKMSEVISHLLSK